MNIRTRLLLLTKAVLLATGTAASGAQITLLNHGEGGLAAQIAAIQGAKHSVDYVTFESDPCSASTQAVLNAMAERAAEGVRVRLLIDGITMDRTAEALFNGFASRNKIEFRGYNDHTFILNKPLRSHIKLLAVDSGTRNAVYFALGRNLSDSYFGLDGSFNMMGRDLMIRESGARQAGDAFEKMWNFRWSRESNLNVVSLDNTCLDDSRRDKSVEARYSVPAAAIASALPQFSCRNVDFFMDDPHFSDARYANDSRGDENNNNTGADFMNEQRLALKHTSRNMLEFIDGTKDILYMENQYYLPVYQLRQAIERARDQRRVKILVLTNSTARIQADLSATMTRQMRRAARRDSKGSMTVVPISGLGAMRSEGRATGTERVRWYIHSKTAVRDHKDVYVGSFNLDQLSFSNNLESGAIVRNCPRLAASIEAEYNKQVQTFNADVKNCPQCLNEMPEQGAFAAIFGFLASSFF